MLKQLTKMSPLRGFVIALALTGMQSAYAAADDVIGRISWSLSDFQYSLVDLTPDDGVAPWIRFFDPAPGVQVYGRKADDTRWWFAESNPGVFDGGEPMAYAHGDNITASRQPDGWQAQIEVYAGDMAGLASPAGHSGETYFSAWNLGMGTVSGDASSPNGWGFELSPNTQLVVTGKIQGETFIDLSPDNLQGLYGDVPKYEQVRLHLYGVLTAANNNYTDGRPNSSSYMISVNGVANKNSWAEIGFDDGVFRGTPQTVDVDWAGGMTNATSDVMEGKINPGLGLNASLTGVPVVKPLPVPEPGALSLMLAGAGVVGWAAHARRRRLKAQA